MKFLINLFIFLSNFTKKASNNSILIISNLLILNSFIIINFFFVKNLLNFWILENDFFVCEKCKGEFNVRMKGENNICNICLDKEEF